MNESTIGYICCAVSVLGFGSNYIPVKKVDVKDGVFFTLCLSVGVCLTGLVQWAAMGFYKFEPFAMLGGLIWAIGNACVPFIVKHCGLGTGQLVWSVTNMGTGWATGTFGLFGKNVDHVQYFGMNVIGVLIVVCSLIPFMFMRDESPADDARSATRPLSGARDVGQELPRVCADEEAQTQQVTVSFGASRFFVSGFVVALIAGVFMGSNFDPPTYLQQIGEPQHSTDPLHYVISHFAGIFLSSLCYFVAYRGYFGQKGCYYGKEIVLPGIGAGILWGIAQIGWFKANSVLSYPVSFPIIVSVPGVMAAIWGVILFGENSGFRNKALLSLVIILQAAGVIIVAASKGNAK